MGNERAIWDAPERPQGFRLKVDARPLERLQHALWAGAIAVALLAAMMLNPVDQFLWLWQSRLASHQPSGDIVFVGADRMMGDPEVPARRSEVAEALEALDHEGVGKIYLDLLFLEPSSTADDKALADVIESLGPRIIVVDRYELDTGERARVFRTIDSIAGKSARVLTVRDPNYLGLTWTMDTHRTVNGKTYKTLSAALAGASGKGIDHFEIDYGIPVENIPALSIQEITKPESQRAVSDLAGKTIVIGRGRQLTDATLAIPTRHSAPPNYIDIYAAETLKGGRTLKLTSLVVLFAVMMALAAVVLRASSERFRWFGYASIALVLPTSLIVTANLGIRIEISYACAMLVAYAAFRSRARWKERVASIDIDTGLPTLRALESWLTNSGPIGGHVVIAKIHGYEHVLKTLRPEDQSSYIHKLVDRLRAADPELTIYFESHYLGWHTAGDDTDAIVEHLEGLRAIFAAPVRVGAHTVDVGITFGVASIGTDEIRRIPAAIAAAEETSEAHEPIKIAKSGSQTDLLWDISLRARIDEAMEAGEIYCVYQPKIDMETNRMVGVEALVRWHDPEKGFISPQHFIQQCEKAGRMEHLTRYVLQSACSAAELLHFRGNAISMSVNISATLLGDMRIVGLVRNVLQATKFDPRYLVLEVTETARISDLSTAAAILSQLKTLGARISIDDFGVGAANFETLFELPFDEIKIDRLFVSNLANSQKARAIASSIVSMGKDARITVVAEGVEDLSDLKILREIGCTQVQGFALSRPVSLSNLLKFKFLPAEVRKNNMV